MQVSQLAGVFRKYSLALSAAGDAGTAASLGEFANILNAAGPVTTKKFAASVPQVEHNADRGTKLNAIIAPCEALNQLLTEAGAKKQVVTDIEVLLEVFRRNRELSIKCLELNRSVASASNKILESGPTNMSQAERIESYLKKLTTALGNDGSFRVMHQRLDADKQMSKADVVEVASRFVSPLPQSTSRPKALRAIMDRHERLLEGRAGSANIGSPKASTTNNSSKNSSASSGNPNVCRLPKTTTSTTS